ncbi:phage holin family protein [Actinomycetospora cinnamomea]|uniref:Putative superfamily III holin-X n=1 Tax=Actinomycetospora cinnamomea TaxID=663609 RepID=A0A2U1FB53_9PSEU|nr:phage holin family protein [Actinomycetospora cinnamomea]PVZ09394.1 putative superfamily III holin-X [Actinomycetospora cinnamomea]
MTRPEQPASGSSAPPVVPSIPLNAEPVRQNGDASVGSLVKEVTTHVSTLVRAEVELAKTEITAEVKKGLQGSVFFVVAGAIAVFSLFFLFIAVAEAFNLIWPSQQWAGYLVTFGLMLGAAGLAGFLGYLKVRKIRAPERTIESAKESVEVLRRGGSDSRGNAA